jgi:FMN phosphatase YigB (HAD superfamily)
MTLQRRLSHSGSVRAEAAGSGVSSVLALDFDGVVCDSSGESSISAWVASLKYWGGSEEIYGKAVVLEERKESVIEETSAVRPIVETGYENLLLSRALLEKKATVEQIIDDWERIRPELMQEWGVNRDELVQAFGDTRDAWIAEDEDSWIGKNRLYPSVAGALKAALQREDVLVYIVTTKQTRYVLRILKQIGGIDFPEERIISSTVSGIPKSTTLCRLMREHSEVKSWHFVEDRYKTLQGIRAKQEDSGGADADLNKLNLYLVDWGFNTQKERALAASDEKIDVIALTDFNQMLEEEFI